MRFMYVPTDVHTATLVWSTHFLFKSIYSRRVLKKPLIMSSWGILGAFTWNLPMPIYDALRKVFARQMNTGLWYDDVDEIASQVLLVELPLVAARLQTCGLECWRAKTFRRGPCARYADVGHVPACPKEEEELYAVSYSLSFCLSYSIAWWSTPFRIQSD